jgi:hypothetical protein
MELTESSMISRSAGVPDTIADGQRVLLDASSAFVALDPVGEHIWDLLVDPLTFGQLTAQLAAAYDVPTTQVAADIGAFLADLQARSLVSVA